MADLQHTTRRAILKAAPMLAAVPAMAMAADPESATLAAFREWWAEWLYLAHVGDEITDAEHEAASFALCDRAEAVLALPVTTSKELVAKILIDTRGGDFMPAPSIMAEIFVLSGLSPA